ncbi:hypothetical protein GCM10009558_106680 [Virgisporangium aurantiacum]
MTSAATPTVPAHNRWVLQALSTVTGRRILPNLCGLRFAGRGTGRTVVLPVAHAACGTDVMVLVGHATDKRWWRNFHDGHPAELLLDGRWRTARGEVVGPDRIEYPRLLAGYRAAHPHTSARTTDPIVHFVVTDRP